MHLITVSFGATACPLLFRTEESAKAAWKQLGIAPAQSIEQLRTGGDSNFPVHIADDFGREVCVRWNCIHGAVFEDLEVSKEGQIEQGLHNGRTQAKLNQRAQADPVLTAMQRAHQQGPAILSPMGGGMNGR